jgi:hypothetical protein
VTNLFRGLLAALVMSSSVIAQASVHELRALASNVSARIEQSAQGLAPGSRQTIRSQFQYILPILERAAFQQAGDVSNIRRQARAAVRLLNQTQDFAITPQDEQRIVFAYSQIQQSLPGNVIGGPDGAAIGGIVGGIIGGVIGGIIENQNGGNHGPGPGWPPGGGGHHGGGWPGGGHHGGGFPGGGHPGGGHHGGGHGGGFPGGGHGGPNQPDPYYPPGNGNPGWPNQPGYPPPGNPGGGYSDPCSAIYSGGYANGNSIVFTLNRAGGNQVSVSFLLNGEHIFQSTGTCDIYPDGGAVITTWPAGPVPSHSATITPHGVMQGQQNPGFAFSANRVM